MAKKSTLSTKNAAILLLVGLAIQEIVPRLPFVGGLSWVGSALILVIALLLLLR